MKYTNAFILAKIDHHPVTTSENDQYTSPPFDLFKAIELSFLFLRESDSESE